MKGDEEMVRYFIGIGDVGSFLLWVWDGGKRCEDQMSEMRGRLHRR